MGSEKSRKWVGYGTAIVGIGLFGMAFISYCLGDYQQFVSSYAWHEGWAGKHVLSVFFQSALRFTLRLSYVLSFIGLLFLRRWSLCLCLVAWLGQLLPGAVFAVLSGRGIDSGHVMSFVSLLIYLALIKYSWPVLKPGGKWRYCVGALFASFILHCLVFIGLFNISLQVAATDDPEMQRQLLQEIRSGNVEGVKFVLGDRNFHPALRGTNCDENTICNLMSYAAMDNSKVEIVRMLQQAGAPIDDQDGGSGDTPIIRALLADHSEIAEYLAEQGIDPLKTNRFGVAAFIVASGEGSPKLLDRMVKSGAPVNFRQKLPDMLAQRNSRIISGVTPLMVAAASGRIDLVETLLKNGADPSLTDEIGRTVRDYGVHGKNPGIEPQLNELMKLHPNK